jgi:hypothetical protein
METKLPASVKQDSTTPKDKTGQPILVGSCIAYGHALGRCAGLRIGKVLKVEFEWKDDVWVENWQTHEKRLHTAGHYEYKIKVWGVDDDYEGHYGVNLCKTAGFLTYPSRILVVDPKTLPPEYVTLLSPVEDGFKYPKPPKEV